MYQPVETSWQEKSSTTRKIVKKNRSCESSPPRRTVEKMTGTFVI